LVAGAKNMEVGVLSTLFFSIEKMVGSVAFCWAKVFAVNNNDRAVKSNTLFLVLRQAATVIYQVLKIDVKIMP
jgi:hypothetical protein